MLTELTSAFSTSVPATHTCGTSRRWLRCFPRPEPIWVPIKPPTTAPPTAPVAGFAAFMFQPAHRVDYSAFSAGVRRYQRSRLRRDGRRRARSPRSEVTAWLPGQRITVARAARQQSLLPASDPLVSSASLCVIKAGAQIRPVYPPTPTRLGTQLLRLPGSNQGMHFAFGVGRTPLWFKL